MELKAQKLMRWMESKGNGDLERREGERIKMLEIDKKKQLALGR